MVNDGRELPEWFTFPEVAAQLRERRDWLEARGFEQVRVSGKLDDPDAPAPGEDVFASMLVSGP